MRLYRVRAVDYKPGLHTEECIDCKLDSYNKKIIEAAGNAMDVNGDIVVDIDHPKPVLFLNEISRIKDEIRLSNINNLLNE